MKRILALGVLVLGCSASAHAQYFGGMIGGSIGSPIVRTPMSVPATHFAVSHVSGTDSDFVPSDFRTFEQAVAEGRAALAAQARTLAQIADENNKAQKAKARLAIVQDASGKVILTFKK